MSHTRWYFHRGPGHPEPPASVWRVSKLRTVRSSRAIRAVGEGPQKYMPGKLVEFDSKGFVIVDRGGPIERAVKAPAGLLDARTHNPLALAAPIP